MLLGSIMNIPDLSGIILEDYNKGVMTQSLIQSICSIAQARNIPVFVDPKFNHFLIIKAWLYSNQIGRKHKKRLDIHYVLKMIYKKQAKNF